MYPHNMDSGDGLRYWCHGHGRAAVCAALPVYSGLWSTGKRANGRARTRGTMTRRAHWRIHFLSQLSGLVPPLQGLPSLSCFGPGRCPGLIWPALSGHVTVHGQGAKGPSPMKPHPARKNALQEGFIGEGSFPALLRTPVFIGRERLPGHEAYGCGALVARLEARAATPKGRNIPAQGNALGSGAKRPTSPVRAAHGGRNPDAA